MVFVVAYSIGHTGSIHQFQANSHIDALSLILKQINTRGVCPLKQKTREFLDSQLCYGENDIVEKDDSGAYKIKRCIKGKFTEWFPIRISNYFDRKLIFFDEHKIIIDPDVAVVSYIIVKRILCTILIIENS